MTSVCICNYGSKEVCVRNVASVCLGCSYSLFSLLAVVEKLSQEEMLDFVGDSILHFVSIRDITHFYCVSPLDSLPDPARVHP